MTDINELISTRLRRATEQFLRELKAEGIDSAYLDGDFTVAIESGAVTVSGECDVKERPLTEVSDPTYDEPPVVWDEKPLADDEYVDYTSEGEEPANGD